jgi:Sec-independent protein secretion pathway component TatC
MNLKLRKGWWIALPVALVALFTPIIAFASSVVPQDTSIYTNQSNLALDDSFEVSNFTPTDVILTTVTVSGVSGVTFSIPTNTGLTREFGYNSWTNVSSKYKSRT